MTLEVCEPYGNVKAKILPFEREAGHWEKAMLELIELNRQGKVEHFIGMWTLKDESKTIHRNWWGESCITCLGMATRFIEEINRFINGEQED